MVCSPLVAGIGALVHCNGEALHEYDDEEQPAYRSYPSSSVYIESVSGAYFSIQLTFCSKLLPPECDFVYDVLLDGRSISSWAVPKDSIRNASGGKKISTVKGEFVSSSSINNFRRFKFADLQITGMCPLCSSDCKKQLIGWCSKRTALPSLRRHQVLSMALWVQSPFWSDAAISGG